nr:hypothetical protein [Micromonospora sp. DSM 115978]
MYDPPETRSESPFWRAVAAVPWIVVSAGVIVMVFLLVTAVGCLPAENRPVTAPPSFVPDWPFAPGGPTTPDAEESRGGATPTGHPGTGSGAPSGAAPGAAMATEPATAPSPTASRTKPAPAPEVTGHYQVMASYDDSFIAEVVVGNVASTGRQWTVELRFPAGVGELRTFWVESAPQATLRRSGGLFVFTSTVALPARSTVPLRFHFDRTGAVNSPSECRVNGASCTIG